jgi:hypothetical protein
LVLCQIFVFDFQAAPFCLVIAVDKESRRHVLHRQRTDVFSFDTAYRTCKTFFPALAANQMSVSTLLQLAGDLATARALDGFFDAHTKVGLHRVIVG